MALPSGVAKLQRLHLILKAEVAAVSVLPVTEVIKLFFSSSLVLGQNKLELEHLYVTRTF